MKFQTYLGSRGMVYSSQQSLIASSVESNSLTVVKSGHMTGTTFCMASIIAYYLENTEYNVFVVSPNFTVARETVLRDLTIVSDKRDTYFRDKLKVIEGRSVGWALNGIDSKSIVLFIEADQIDSNFRVLITEHITHPKSKIIIQGNPLRNPANTESLLRYVDSTYYWKPYAPNRLILPSIHQDNVWADSLGRERPIKANPITINWVRRMISEKCTVKESEQYSTEENFLFKGLYYRPKIGTEFKPRVLGLWEDEKIPLSM